MCTHEGSGHCLLKISNSTGSIKVIKWTNCYTPLRNYSCTSGNHTCSWPSLVYFLMSDKVRVWKKKLPIHREFLADIECKFFAEQKRTWMHNISFCQLESTFGSPDWERAHMSGQTKMIGTRGGVMCNGQPAPILNSSCGQRVMAKTKMESFARFSSNSLHSIYSQHIAFKRQYLMSYRTIYSFNLSS